MIDVFALGHRHLTVHRMWPRRYFKLFRCDLDAAFRSIDRRKAIDASFGTRQLPDENRKTLRHELVMARFDVEPMQRLAIDFEMARMVFREQSRQPRTGRDDQLRGLERTGHGPDFDDVAILREFRDDLIANNLGAERL